MPHSAPGVNVYDDGVFVRRTQDIDAKTNLTATPNGTHVDLDASGGGAGTTLETDLDGVLLSATTASINATEGLYATAITNAITYSVYGARAGTLASRPAAARSNKRGLWYATDTKTAYVSDGSTWTTLFVLGTISSQDASAVAITGGSITGITDLAVADGGTGASTAAAARSNLGALMGLARTSVKTANYVAVAGDLVPVDTTGGAVTITLPNAPADQSIVCVKDILQGGTNTITVNCAGSDTFNRTGGATTSSLALLAQGAVYHYTAAAAVWTLVATDVPLSQLDLRFQPLDADLTAVAALATTAFGRSHLVEADAAAGRALIGVDAALATRIAAMTAIGDSWIAGTTTSNTGTFLMEKEGSVARLCSLLGVHEDNLLHLGMGASALTNPVGSIVGGGTNAFGGWAGIAQFILPNDSALIADSGTANSPNAQISPTGAFVVSYINDPITNIFSASTQGRAAWKLALRWAASRCRASAVFSSRYDSTPAIVWDSALAFGASWTTTASVTKNTGPAYRQLTALAGTAADAIVFTIPAEFKGGYVVPTFIGSQNAMVATTAVINDTSAGVKTAWASTAEFPQTGNFILHIQSEDILCSVNSPTSLLFITRGVNGTTAAVHNAIGLVCTITAPQVVTFTTNATGADATAITSPGTLAIGAQGYGGQPVPVCRRFNLTSAAAGKTITMTVTGRVAGDVQPDIFDAVHIETPTPGPFVVRNFPRFGFGGVYSGFTATDWNADIATIQAEFDSSFQIADLDTYWYARSCTISTAGVGASLAVVANSTDFPGDKVGWVLTCQGEDMLVTATSGSFPNYTLTTTRGYNSTTPATHAGQLASDGSFTHTDRVHPNGLGHQHVALAFYNAFNAAISQSTFQPAAQAGTWTQDNHSPVLGMSDLSYVKPPVVNALVGAGIATNLNVLRAIPVYVPQECTVVQMSVRQGTVAGVSTVVRFGIYDQDGTRQRPGNLIAEMGQVSSNTTSSTRSITCYKRLRPGWYWLAVVQQGTTAGSLIVLPTNGLVTGINSLVDINAATDAGVAGYVTGSTVTGALPATWPSYTESIGGTSGATSLPYITMQVRTKHYA